MSCRQNFFLYAVHAHPVLRVTTCSSCADAAYAAEDDVLRILERRRRAERMGEICLDDDNEDDNDGEEDDGNAELCAWCMGVAPSFASLRRSSKGNGGNDGGNDDSLSDGTASPTVAGIACVDFSNGDDDDEVKDVDADDDKDRLLLCDACPRSFCVRCVRLAHGGGRNGAKRVKEVEHSEEGDGCRWDCPACDPTPCLRDMREAFRKLAGDDVDGGEANAAVGKGGGRGRKEEEDDENDDNEDDESSVSSSLSSSALAARLIEELNEAEDGIAEAEVALEPAAVEEQRGLIRDELLSRSSFCRGRRQRNATTTKKNDEAIDRAVEDELEAWRDEWRSHHSRLSESITALQEALEVRGVDLSAFYAVRKKELLTEGNKNDGADKGEEEEGDKLEEDGNHDPDWKKSADAELDRRDQEAGTSRGAFRGASGEWFRVLPFVPSSLMTTSN